MAVVRCQCGSRFNAATHLAGKQVPCPACGRTLQIPAQRVEVGMVACKCGRRFMANASLAGKTVACPSCQRPILIPAGTAVPKPTQSNWDLGDIIPASDAARGDSPFAAGYTPTFAPSPMPAYAARTIVTPRSAGKQAVSKKTIVLGIVAMMVLVVFIVVGIAARKAWVFFSGGPEFANLPSSQESIAAAEAKGEPMTPEALESYYRIPAGTQDTTQIWVAAGKPLQTDEFETEVQSHDFLKEWGTNIPLPGETWSELSAATALLKKYRETLQLAHQAARQGSAARYPTKFSDGFSMLMPEVQNVRDVARLLIVEAHVHAHQGDAAACANALRAAYGVAHSLDGFPTQVAGLVRIAISTSADATLLKLMPYVEFSDADMLGLRADVERLRAAKNFQTTSLGERVILYSVFADPAKFAPEIEGYTGVAMESDDNKKFIATAIKTTGEQDKAFILHLMEGVAAASQQPFPQSLDSIAKVQAEYDKIKTANRWAKLRRPFSTLLFPAIPEVANAYGRAEANHRIVLAMLAIERYRRDTGSFPNRIQELTPKYLPEILSDPFDGLPLRYRKQDKQLILYSVGYDRRDDGGTGDESQTPDIVHRIPLTSPAERRDRFAALKSRSTSLPKFATGKVGRTADLLAGLSGKWDLSTVKGNWQYRDRVLWSSASDVAGWKSFPGEVPASYRIHADIVPISGEGSFNLAFAVDGRPIMLVLDGWDGQHSGLNMVQGKTGNDNVTTYRGRVLRAGQTNKVAISVQTGSVEVSVNGNPIINWSGDSSELSLDQRFWPAWSGKIYVGSWKTAFRLDRLELESH